ncbi:MAG: cytochrome d ubiquinol oxidase subunit II [Bacteroidales bacterium]|nr:cytochrome d ubiquinol oxidase subunit II [Bacteroidales bacterium]
MEYSFLQAYWWILISILGAVLVFMLFVQGGQTLLMGKPAPENRALMFLSLGKKWELTFTTLVVFGGAFFAAFPLFYSTSFGGAYWLWMLILFSFVIQAVAYEFRNKPRNVFGPSTYDTLLILNGVFGPLLLGVAVGIMFFGGDFTVEKGNILDNSAPVISQWGSAHGLEAIVNWKNLLMGFMVLFLARTLGALYFVNDINDSKGFGMQLRIQVLTSGTIFALLFVSFIIVLCRTTSLREVAPGVFEPEKYVYFHNFLEMWGLIPVFVIAVLSVLYGIYRTAFSSTWRSGIWFAGAGTIVVVFILFLIAGFGSTPYYPSFADPSSSLTIANSSSTPYTLEVMAWVSLVIPVVIFYISYVWKKMNAKPITPADIKDSH